MDALSFSLCFDTASLAHCDAVRGERHPPHLRTNRCDEAQGYYFSKPVDAKEYARLLAAGIEKPIGSPLDSTELAQTVGPRPR
jgi:hypothetical protein